MNTDNKIKIDTKNLNLFYGSNQALHDINVSLFENKITALIGPSGCGKSTFLRCINRMNDLIPIVKIDGQIIIDNKKLGTDIDLPENLAGIIEEPGFLENYSAYKNLQFLSMIKNKIGKEEIIQTLKSVRLDPYSKLHVGKYSMGMKQRLGIAQAIMEKPEILILDEPMNGLDNDGVMEMRKLFINLREEGTMIIIASHNKEDIEVLCDEVFEMEKGKLTPVQH